MPSSKPGAERVASPGGRVRGRGPGACRGRRGPGGDAARTGLALSWGTMPDWLAAVGIATVGALVVAWLVYRHDVNTRRVDTACGMIECDDHQAVSLGQQRPAGPGMPRLHRGSPCWTPTITHPSGGDGSISADRRAGYMRATMKHGLSARSISLRVTSPKELGSQPPEHYWRELNDRRRCAPPTTAAPSASLTNCAAPAWTFPATSLSRPSSNVSMTTGQNGATSCSNQSSFCATPPQPV